MAVLFNELETGLESTVHRQGQDDDAIWERYLERRRHVVQFLRSNLSLLQHHRGKVELLQKCYFYLKIEPKHVSMRDQDNVIHHTDIFQLIDLYQLQKMMKVGKTQTEIQLSLLTELLEQLEQGREELSYYVETCDVLTFLSRWDLITQRLAKLSEFMQTLLSLQVPGRLYSKHRVLSHAVLGGSRLPNIRLSLCTKMPVIFDRNKSFADRDWAKLQWFSKNQGSHLERYELQCNLLTNGAEVGYRQSQELTSNSCTVPGLQPGRSYEFIIRRSDVQTLVLVKWYDSIILKTKPKADSSTGAPED